MLFTCSHAYADMVILPIVSEPTRIETAKMDLKIALNNSRRELKSECSESQLEEIDDVCFESTSDDLYKECLVKETLKQCGDVTVAEME